MDPHVETALRASIAKWERNAEAQNINDYRLGAANCPLCWRFNPPQGLLHGNANKCIGCPVFEKTGVPICDDTPYGKVGVVHVS